MPELPEFTVDGNLGYDFGEVDVWVKDAAELIEAAQTFREKHERFHPDHWVAAQPDKFCDACDLCAVLARYDEAE